MKKIGIAIFSCGIAGALAGCNESPVEAKRSDAIFECLQRSWILQGYAEREPGGEPKFTPKGEEAAKQVEVQGASAPSPPTFRLTATGDFVVDYGEVSSGPFPPYKLLCTGDFNRGVFETVQVNDIIHRPSANELWPIEWFGDQAVPE